MTNTTSITDTDRLEFLFKHKLTVNYLSNQFHALYEIDNCLKLIASGDNPRDVLDAAICKYDTVQVEQKQRLINQLKETIAKLEDLGVTTSLSINTNIYNQ